MKIRQEQSAATEVPKRADYGNAISAQDWSFAFKSLKSARGSKLTDPVVALALSFIRQHALKKSLRVPDIARHCGVSRVTLERRFKKCLGRSPGQEIGRVRLARAKKLLEETDLLITEVAKATGLNSSNSKYFSLWFFNKTGQRPRMYRQLKRQSKWLAEQQRTAAMENDGKPDAPLTAHSDGSELKIFANQLRAEPVIRTPRYCPECGCNLLTDYWPATRPVGREISR